MDMTTIVSLVVLGVLLVLYMVRRKSRLDRDADMD
jgi:hypothetical protein